ncbi:zinc finger protein ZAT1-like [Bidens hawaiensis]|uniref:zinc finger protein ZAT1-like n=1 Tax=Bidens hawaiensis TaxID=980011 RepID=UPI00404AA249
MDEDLDVELRFVCKLCDKRFPSGKSLGGHMRSHVITATAANSTELYDNGKNSSSNLYGLRENPKKSWRASSSSTLTFPNERICNQCGKKFQSLKALCGHMAFHSDKDRRLKDYDHSWTSENLDHEDKLNVDSDSGTEEIEHQDPVFVTRSKSRRYNFGSSSVSEIDEYELEQVAMCLMMLSKDSSNWVGVNSVLESNSGNCKDGIKGFNYKDLSYEEKQEIRRNLFREFGYDNSLKKRIRDDDDDGSCKKNKYECLNCNKTFSSFQGLGGHKPCHKKNNAFKQKAKLKKKIRPKKNKRHECPICYRMFESGQALGGHKRSHFIDGSEDRLEAVATYKDMIDLNLPAPEED